LRIWAFFFAEIFTCDSVSRSILPELTRFLAVLFQAIALSAKGLFFTIQKISSNKIFLMGAWFQAT
jgi:hypothetical protein